ncbi:MAG: GWxTD domain-containing protein [Ignavibacteria bacterium]|nr:GWxTD domain-containing protein [Ignavibacteria bacterium]
MKKAVLIFSFLITFFADGYCQDKIFFNFDYAVFRGDENNSFLELYYSINQKSLTYEFVNEKYEAAARLHVKIFNTGRDILVYEKEFKTPTVISDTSDVKLKQNLIGQLNFLLPDGDYKLEIKGSDFNDSSKSDLFSPEIKIDNHTSQGLKISDIEIATQIVKSSNENSIFYKNTLEVIPNPSSLFGMNLNVMNYYYEIYGLTADNISKEFYLVKNILNLNQELMMSSVKKVTTKNESKVDFGTINVDSLDRGSYIFRVSLIDSIKKINLTAEKKFYVFNVSENVKDLTDQNDFLKSEYVNMTPDALEQEFKYSNYIMTEKEIDTYKDLKDLNDKRKFMYSFWQSKDPNPVTQQLEYKTDYLKRIQEANKNFKEAYMEGWKTDRGRIYVMYGKPEDIERFPFESENKAYEIWKYHTLQGGVECVFIERQISTGEYYLAHSTMRNELSNPNWEKDLK